MSPVCTPIISLLVVSFALSGVLTAYRNVTPTVIEEQLLWIKEQAEVSLYRIPIITSTPRGTLIAVSEARKSPSGDSGAKFLAIRRSLDTGYTWKSQDFLLDDGSVTDGLNLGVILADHEKDIVFIMYTMCAHYKDCSTSTTHVIKSLDDGVSWSKSINISEQIGTKMFAPGPGYGIQKRFTPHKGRLIVCGHFTINNDYNSKGVACLLSDDHGQTWRYGGSVKAIPFNQPTRHKDFIPNECQKKYAPHKGRLIVCGHGTISGDGVFCLLSDDHGDTWRYGGMIKSIPYNQPKKSGDFEPDECQPVELPDGSIMVNMRNQGRYHCSCRVVTRSFDGAETFSFDNLYFDTALIEPVCAASILYHNDVLFFSNPMSTSKRVNLNLQWSYDNGTTWAGKLAINPDYSGYSCMTSFQNTLKYGNDIFIFYERGHESTSAMDSLSLVRIRLY